MISAKILEIATKKPYVVLIGPVGSGKTTLAEKLSGKSNLGTQGINYKARHTL
jgi:putative ribosome biogenesis GTPase RsgA